MRSLSLFFFLSYVYGDVRVDPLVQIQQGLVRGQRSNDGTYSTFLGIPYASVDLNNPFGAPNPPPPFEDTFNANDGAIQCPQSGFSSGVGERATLDCLRLNIYVPTEAGSNNPLPVLVWIHGGGFGIGWAGDYEPRFLVRDGIIVVTINYRLGPYGFLCLNTPLVPGNQGLKDQYEALRWISQNIASFGGSPHDITLAGQSAGAMSVLLQLYSTRPKLFHKVIAQSGTSTSLGLMGDADEEAATKLAAHLGYTATDTEDALRFLSNTHFELVAGAAEAINLWAVPCMERSFSGVETFIESHPMLATNETKAAGTPILIGHTSLEMSFGAFSTSDPFTTRLSNLFNFEEDEVTAIGNIVRHFYIGDKPVSNEVEYELAQFSSDGFANYPTQQAIDNLLNENAGPIYSYLFSYVGASGNRGAPHGGELPYLFKGFNSETVDDDEGYLVMQRMTTLWTNFVKYGNPTPSVTDLLPVTWEPVSATSRPYLNIDSELKLDSRVFHDRMAFWDLLYSAYSNRHRLYRKCN